MYRAIGMTLILDLVFVIRILVTLAAGLLLADKIKERQDTDRQMRICVFPENTQPDENKDRTTVFLSTRIYPGDGAPFSGHVKVSGTKIVDAGPGRPKEVTDSPGQDEAGNIVDLGDNIVIPGLIDLHIHGSYGFDVASQILRLFLQWHGIWPGPVLPLLPTLEPCR